MNKVHFLKIHPEPFGEVEFERKKAEFRNNDRGFKVGDTVFLQEWDLDEYTGRQIEASITHIQTGYGIPDGYVMLSLEVRFVAGHRPEATSKNLVYLF